MIQHFTKRNDYFLTIFCKHRENVGNKKTLSRFVTTTKHFANTQTRRHLLKRISNQTSTYFNSNGTVPFTSLDELPMIVSNWYEHEVNLYTIQN